MTDLPTRAEVLELHEAAPPTRAFHLHAVATPVPAVKGTVGVIGLGYVGLTTALSLLDGGYRVLGFDRSTDRLESVGTRGAGLTPEERDRLERNEQQLSLHHSDDTVELETTDAVLICVPTPVDDYQVPDLRPLHDSCARVVAGAVEGQLIVLASTTYVGTTQDLIIDPLIARGFEIGRDIFVAFSPERVDPGNTLHPQEEVPRVVGGATPACTERARLLLEDIASKVHCVQTTQVAELSKLYENTFRAVNIALANELADICGELDINVMDVVDAAATKPYGFLPFYPGPGVGGHCIPIDPHYLLWQLKARRHAAPVIEQAMSSVAARPGRVVQRIIEVLAEHARPTVGARVMVVGVTYKPGVADFRSSPALEIIDRLAAAGAVVSYHDPLVPQVRTASGEILSSSSAESAEGCDLVVICCTHQGHDYTWLADHANVLDTTYRRTIAQHASVV